MSDHVMSLEFAASSGKAVDQLDKIIESLGRIEKALDGLTKPLTEMKAAFDKIGATKVDLKIDQSSIDEAIKKLQKLDNLQKKTGKGGKKTSPKAEVEMPSQKDIESAIAAQTDDLSKSYMVARAQYEKYSQILKENQAKPTGKGFDLETNRKAEIMVKEAEAVMKRYQKILHDNFQATGEIDPTAKLLPGLQNQGEEIDNLIRKMKELKRIIAEKDTGSGLISDKEYLDAKVALKGVKKQYDDIIKSAERASQLGAKAAESPISSTVENPLANIAQINPGEEISKGFVDANDALKSLFGTLENAVNVMNEFKDTADESFDFRNNVKGGIIEINKVLDYLKKLRSEGRKGTDKATESDYAIASGWIPQLEKFKKAFESTASSTVEKNLDSMLPKGIEQQAQGLGRIIQRLNQYKAALKEMPKNENLPGWDDEAYKRLKKNIEYLEHGVKRYEEAILGLNKPIAKKETLREAAQGFGRVYERLRQYNEEVKKMRSGEIPWDDAGMRRALKGIQYLEHGIKKYNETVLGTQNVKKKKVDIPKPDKESTASWGKFKSSALSALDAVDKAANKLTRVLKVAFSPLTKIGTAIKSSMSDSLKKVGREMKEFGEKVKKVTGLWRKFTNTLVYSLIFRVISTLQTGMKEAIDSLAQFSNEVGTSFNNSISHLVANFQAMSRAILGAFEPLINSVIPILNALTDKVIVAGNYISQFFAYLTGQQYAMKAVKRVENYAESLDSAANSAKKLKSYLLGIDELNVFDTQEEEADDEKKYMEEWEITPISSTVKSIADALKELAADIFEPLKKAWDETKDYLSDSFKLLGRSLVNLFKDIARDWLAVWKQPETEEIFESILRSIGNIANAIRLLAENFREAWNYAGTGKKILEDIRDIIGILVGWIEKATEYFMQWAQGINFKPLLVTFEELLDSLKKIADFVGGVLYDVFTRVFLKFIKFMIEEGIPNLNKALKTVVDAFPAEELRNRLHIVEDAIERLAESVWNGIVKAIENLGLALDKFLASDEFLKFLERLAYIMDKIDSEDVAKILTGIGLAIGKLAKYLIKFVNSQQFKDFIDMLDNWMASHTAEDIADILVDIAKAIALFKFTAFAGKGLIKFTEFIGTLRNLVQFSGVGSILKSIGEGLSALGLTAPEIALVAGAVALLVAVLVKLFATDKEFRSTVMKTVADVMKSIGNIISAIDKLISALARLLAAPIKALVKIFSVEIVSALQVITGAIDLITGLLSGDWKLAARGFVDVVGGFIKQMVAFAIKAPAVILELVGSIFEQIGKLLEDVPFVGEIFKIGGQIMQGLADGLMSGLDLIVEWVNKIIAKVKEILGIHSPSKVFHEIGEFCAQGLINGIGIAIELIVGVFKELVDKIKELFANAIPEITKGWEEVKTFFEGVATGIKTAFEENISKISGFFTDALTVIQDAWKSLAEWFQTEVIDKIRNGFSELCEKINEFFAQAWTDISTLWGTVHQWFVDNIFDPLYNGFFDLLEAVQKFFDDAWTFIKGVWEKVAAWFKEKVIDPVYKLFNELTEAIKNFFTTLWEKIKEIWVEAQTWFKEQVTDPVYALFKQLKEDIETFFQECYDKILEIWEPIVEWFRTTITEPLQRLFDDMTSAIKGFFESLFNSIVEGAGRAFGAVISGASAALSKVAALIDSIKWVASNIGSVVSDIGHWAQDQAKRIVDAINNGAYGNVPQYATGGFPDGENGFFFANSSELVGKFTNGKTAVANNAQIVNGIAVGVSQAVTESLAGYLADIANNQREQIESGTSITLDGRELVGSLEHRRSRNGYDFEL